VYRDKGSLAVIGKAKAVARIGRDAQLDIHVHRADGFEPARAGPTPTEGAGGGTRLIESDRGCPA